MIQLYSIMELFKAICRGGQGSEPGPWRTDRGMFEKQTGRRISLPIISQAEKVYGG